MAKRKVKLHVSVQGHVWAGKPGDIVKMETAEAQRFIEAGMASEIDEPSRLKPERATKHKKGKRE